MRGFGATRKSPLSMSVSSNDSGDHDGYAALVYRCRFGTHSLKCSTRILHFVAIHQILDQTSPGGD